MDDLLWDLRALIWLVAAGLIAFGTYIVWPSRWNVPAHLAVAFFTIAQAIPVALLGALDSQPREIVVSLLKVHALSALFFTVGLALGATIPSRKRAAARWATLVAVADSRPILRRTAWALVLAFAALGIAVLVMGFVPMFAADPLAAKFFRGSYGDAYRPVAPLYRAGTTVITLLIPVAAVFAVVTRRIGWTISVLIALSLMIVTLQRGPAFSGILLALGVLLVARKHTAIYLGILIGSYVAGTLFYFILGTLGVDSFEGTQLTGGSLLATVAATAPDIQDEFWFYNRWVLAGEPLTYGQTFLGGLVPGNFAWNPGVWTLTLGDPRIDVSQISSGGLRLPLPIWGLVSFGVIGVPIISIISGLFAGYFARLANHLMATATDLLARVWLLAVYGTITAICVTFYTLSYLEVVQLIALLWILRGAVLRPRVDRHLDPSRSAPWAVARLPSSRRARNGAAVTSRRFI